MVAVHGPAPEVTLDFLGKDSVRYHRRVAVDPVLWANLAAFVKGRRPGDPLFEGVTVCGFHSCGWAVLLARPWPATRLLLTLAVAVNCVRARPPR